MKWNKMAQDGMRGIGIVYSLNILTTDKTTCKK